jgi:hypothetical protein
MKAKWQGQEFEATGRVVMQTTSDGETSTWEEWVLVSPEGSLLYLEFDEGKWKLSEPFVPDRPVSPAEATIYSPGRILNLDGTSARVVDSATGEIAHVEGEFPWIVSVGRRSRYIDAVYLNRFYCIEWTDREIEFFRGQFLDDRQVFIMFGLHHLVVALERRQAMLRSRLAFGGVCLLAGFVAFVFWAAALLMGNPVTGAAGTVALTQLGAEGVRYGPFQLTALNRVHRLEIEGRMRETSAWIAAVLEDEEERELVSVDREMWDESGVEGGERWHESDLRAAAHFVLREPGTFYIRLYGEPDTVRRTGATAPDQIQASFRLKERTLYPTYPLVLGIVLVAFGILFLVLGAPSTVHKVWQGLTND